MEMRLEVVVLPVSDVDRALAFYRQLGWRLDVDATADGVRFVQITPPGSACSIVFGSGLTLVPPESTQGLHLIVTDIEAARAELRNHGANVSEIFHDTDRIYFNGGTPTRSPGLDPQRRSYASFASFCDPDGNGWLLQEITQRLPDRTD